MITYYFFSLTSIISYFIAFSTLFWLIHRRRKTRCGVIIRIISDSPWTVCEAAYISQPVSAFQVSVLFQLFKSSFHGITFVMPAICYNSVDRELPFIWKRIHVRSKAFRFEGKVLKKMKLRRDHYVIKKSPTKMQHSVGHFFPCYSVNFLTIPSCFSSPIRSTGTPVSISSNANCSIFDLSQPFAQSFWRECAKARFAKIQK